MGFPFLAAGAIGAQLLGGILGRKSKNKQQDQTNQIAEQDFQRRQLIEDQRARSRAIMLTGMLKGYGKAGEVNEEQLFQILRKPVSRTLPSATAGRNMGEIGNGLSGIGNMLLMGMRGDNRANGSTSMLSGDPSLMGSPAPGSELFGGEE